GHSFTFANTAKQTVLRIAVNARFLIKGRLEGIGWYSYQVLKHMVGRHPEHEYLFFFDRPYDPEFVFNDSVTPIVLHPPARHPILWYLWFEWAIPRALKRHRADVFFSPDGYGSMHTGIPQYIVVHDLAFLHFPEQVPFWVRKYYQYFVPRHLRKAKRLFAVSQATKNDIVRQLGISSESISIAYNGVREEFKPLDPMDCQLVWKQYSQGQPYFLYVGAIHPRKNIMSLIRAFDRFKRSSSSDIMLLLVGRKAWQNKELEQAYENAEFKEDILFLPYLDTVELAKVTGAAFAAVNPSWLEGFGVPILEALACDVPVIVSSAFSLPEVGGPGALLFDPASVEQLTHALALEASGKDRQERIALGRMHKKNFDWKQTSEAIYRAILGKSDIKKPE
ncbi:MAG TPA: glycosyltransferase family 1 protein, partial [Saprospiraceae bacterium]|nr:glycosyltransferase family 1 protein [Saprospiraceae bacterium]